MLQVDKSILGFANKIIIKNRQVAYEDAVKRLHEDGNFNRPHVVYLGRLDKDNTLTIVCKQSTDI